MNRQRLLCTLATVTLATASLAQPPGGERRKPPAEAITACESVADEAQCQFTGRRDESVTGVCRTVPSGERACVPDRHRGDDGQRPDRESSEL